MLRLALYKVAGQSMVPTMFDGDYVLCCRWIKFKSKLDDIVVVRHPNYGHIVKRVADIDQYRRLKLAGDNHFISTSADEMGRVEMAHVLGKVIFKIKRRR